MASKHERLEELRRIRDEVFEKIKRGSKEAQEYWKRDLEPQLEKLEREVAAGTEEIVEATGELFTNMGRALRQFAGRLREGGERSEPPRQVDATDATLVDDEPDPKPSDPGGAPADPSDGKGP